MLTPKLWAANPTQKLYTVTIASGTTSTSTGDIGGNSIVGLLVPVSIASVALTFTVSVDGTNFYPLKNSDKTAYTITTDGTATAYYFDPTIFYGFRYAKVIAGSSETAQTFTFIARPLLG